MEIETTIEGKELVITDPDRLLWPKIGVTKLDYINYLHTVSHCLLPYTNDRMLMMWLYPHGIDSRKIEKRSLPDSAPDWIPTTFYKKKNRILLNNHPTLIWTANYGATELHVPFDYYNNENYPTELAFDLDPPDDASFDLVLEVALELKVILDKLGLESIPKTSGKTGLQIHVPIESRYTFQETRTLNKFIADYLLEKMPDKITLERLVRKRGKKLYFDYLQLWAGRTMPAPYSVRAADKATVATPVTWEEIRKGIHPADFTIMTVPNRIDLKGDLFYRKTNNRHNLDRILEFIKINT